MLHAQRISSVPLAVRTAFDLERGMGRVADLVTRARGLGYEALGVADLNSTYAWWPLQEEARRAGIRPIFGVRLHLEPAWKLGDRDTHPGLRPELILLACNDDGLNALRGLVTRAHLECGESAPAITLEDLVSARGNILALDSAACGPLARSLIRAQPEWALRWARRLRDTLGHDAFYLQVAPHTSRRDVEIEPERLRIARELDIPLVADGDVRYVEREDAVAHAVLQRLRRVQRAQGSPATDFESAAVGDDAERGAFHLKSPSEMQRLFRDLPEALANTQTVAARCQASLFTARGGSQHAGESPRHGWTPEHELRRRCMRALDRWCALPGNQSLSVAARDRIDHELTILEEKKLASCFLVVQDVVRYAKEEGIPVGPVRGFMADSLVAHLLDLSPLHPWKFGGPLGAIAMRRTHGPEEAGRPPRIALPVGRRGRRQIARWLRQSRRPGVVAALPRIVPIGRNALWQAWQQAHLGRSPGRDAPRRRARTAWDPQWMDVGRRLEDLPDHVLLDAGRLLLLDPEACPRVALERGAGGIRLAQLAPEALEAAEIPWLQLDLDAACTREERILDRLHREAGAGSGKAGPGKVPVRTPWDRQFETTEDEPTYRVLARGWTRTIAPLASDRMRNRLRNKQPARFTDLVEWVLEQQQPAIEPTAEYPQGVRFLEELPDLLRSWSALGEAEAGALASALHHGEGAALRHWQARFLSGALDRGHGLPEAEAWWQTLRRSVPGLPRGSELVRRAYAIYRQAWWLAHAPRAWYAVALEEAATQGGTWRAVAREILERGERLLDLDINASDFGFRLEPGGIRVGLCTLAEVDAAWLQGVVRERRRGGRFRSLGELQRRCPSPDRRVWQRLRAAGALRGLPGAERASRSASGAARTIPNRRSPGPVQGRLGLGLNPSRGGDPHPEQGWARRA